MKHPFQVKANQPGQTIWAIEEFATLAEARAFAQTHVAIPPGLQVFDVELRDLRLPNDRQLLWGTRADRRAVVREGAA